MVLGLNWLSAKTCPIGIDFGAESIKAVQLQREDDGIRIVAAGQKHVPASMSNDPGERMQFYGDAVRELLCSRPFKGRKVVTAVPSEHLFIQHLRVAKMSEADLAKTLPWEANGKLPFPAREAVLRQVVAADLFVDQEPKNEVILMASPRAAVERYLETIARAKLEVQAVLVGPQAVLEAFRFLFTRADEQNMATLFLDIGAAQTSATVTHSTKLVFARQIPVGGRTIAAAIAARLDCSMVQAEQLRATAPARATALAGGGPAQAAADPRADAVDQATAEQIDRLTRELGASLRYYQSLFPDRAIDRIVFLGGQAHHKRLCQQIAKGLRLPAQLGDPMLRMHRMHRPTVGGELPPGTPAPEWAVAFGCSLAGQQPLT